MSDPLPLLLTGATGLVGLAVIAAAARDPGAGLAALARRPADLPPGARLEMLVADPADWPAAIARARPRSIAIAIGTTIRDQGGDRAKFRAIDHDLALMVARAAREAGARQAILVSSAGAAAQSRNFYLSVKGETEVDIAGLRFPRLDILRPGMLIGARQGASRPAERIGQMLSPLIDPLLPGGLAAYRSVRAADMGAAILMCARLTALGRHVHDAMAIRGLAADWRATF